MKKKTVCVLTVILCASLGLSGCSLFPFEQDLPFHKSETENTDVESAGNTPLETEEEQNAETDEDGNDIQEITDGQSEEEADSPLEQASLMAAQYDYDKAIELLKSQPDYDSNTDMQNAVSEYENTKAACTEYPLEQITHVFFHTLIKDTSKAFDGDSDSDGYNQYMTTIDEFNKIIQSMYDKGYVMVSPHDMEG